ncbi:hypothetical protein M8J75_014826 [Diaphorina citri]|nr:hypothetical protein M8J75_014826 [Diaphorina citri]
MLHEINPYICGLKTAIEQSGEIGKEDNNFQVIISAEKQPDAEHRGRFNAPKTSEVAIVIVGQVFEKRDIIIQARDDKLMRISETHRSYDSLQYPLIFCYGYGEDGYAINIL